MLTWLNHLAHAIEQKYDRAKWVLRYRLGIGPVKILPYAGYGTRSKATILGRIVADYSVSPATEADSIGRNIANMFRRFNSHEIPFATVQVRFQNQTVVTQANDEGHFQFNWPYPSRSRRTGCGTRSSWPWSMRPGQPLAPRSARSWCRLPVPSSA